MLEAYRAHVAERAEMGIVPEPLNATQVADLIELLKSPPAGEEELLMDLFTNRVPAGVDRCCSDCQRLEQLWAPCQELWS